MKHLLQWLGAAALIAFVLPTFGLFRGMNNYVWLLLLFGGLLSMMGGFYLEEFEMLRIAVRKQPLDEIKITEEIATIEKSLSSLMNGMYIMLLAIAFLLGFALYSP